jgi:predicted translin family RNA/ssDNA-binding protein
VEINVMANNRRERRFFSKGNLFGLITLIIGIAGIIISIIVPVWQTYMIQTPFLSIELVSIDRKPATGAGISRGRDLELEVLEPPIQVNPCEEPPFRYRTRVIPTREDSSSSSGEILTYENLSKSYDKAKKEMKKLQDLVPSLRQVLKDLESLTPDNTTPDKIRRYINTLNDYALLYANFDPKKFEDNTTNNKYSQELLKDIIEIYKECVSKYENRLENLRNKLPVADNKITEIKDEILNEKSQFIIKAVLINSGRANISIKQQALLRVYGNANDYEDIRLSLKDFDHKAEIPSYRTQMTSLESENIENLSKDYRETINRFWNKSDYSILFIEDSLGNIHSSNRLPFSQGTYERNVYSHLATEASKTKYLPSGR